MAEKAPKQSDKAEKRPVGRPPLEHPDPIPDTPENVARIVVNTPHKPRDEWEFVKKQGCKACED